MYWVLTFGQKVIMTDLPQSNLMKYNILYMVCYQSSAWLINELYDRKVRKMQKKNYVSMWICVCLA